MADADRSGFFTPLHLACLFKYAGEVAVLQSAEDPRVPEGLAEDYGRLCYSQGHSNTQGAELSDYFANRYLDGDLYDGRCYSYSNVGELLTYEYKASDGNVMVWRHAFDLRAFGKQGEDVITLYHYTHDLAFRNVGDLDQMAAQLFASLKDDRAHFGQGVYATKHEPAVWGSRRQILLNNYIKDNGDPLCPDASEEERVETKYGTGQGESGHRAAFCIPLIVPRCIAYNSKERPTPDLAEMTVKGPAGQERPIKPGEDREGRPVHHNRDVWVIVIKLETDGKVQDAETTADSILDLLQLRLQKLRGSAGDDVPTADCMYELARRLDGRARYEEAEELYRECLRIRRAKLGDEHPHTLNCLNNMAFVVKTQGRLAEAEALYREALKKSRAIRGDDHPHTLNCLNNMALFLRDQGRLAEAEPLHREELERSRAILGEHHPDTLTSLNNMALLLQAQGHLVEAEPLYRKALEKSRAILGEDHPDTLTRFNNMALLLQAQGHLAEAEPLFRKALEKRRLKLGNQHPQTVNSIYNLADLLKSMKKFEEAEELFCEHLAARVAVHGEDHEKTVVSRRNLVKFLEERGKVDKAQELRRLDGQTVQRTAQ